MLHGEGLGSYVVLVTKPRMQRAELLRKDGSDLLQTVNLELFRSPLYHFPAKMFTDMLHRYVSHNIEDNWHHGLNSWPIVCYLKTPPPAAMGPVAALSTFLCPPPPPPPGYVIYTSHFIMFQSLKSKSGFLLDYASAPKLQHLGHPCRGLYAWQ